MSKYKVGDMFAYNVGPTPIYITIISVRNTYEYLVKDNVGSMWLTSLDEADLDLWTLIFDWDKELENLRKVI